MKKIVLLLVMSLLLTGCYLEKDGTIVLFGSKNKTPIKEKKELLEALDNMDCFKSGNVYLGASPEFEKIVTTNVESDKCGIKGKYDVVDELLYKDEDGDDVREIVLKLKDYDVEFSVFSKMLCTEKFEQTCVDSTYDDITTNYFVNLKKYFGKQFNNLEKIDLCDAIKSRCSIYDENDTKKIEKYINDYKSYLSQFDFGFKQAETVRVCYKGDCLKRDLDVKIDGNYLYYYKYYGKNEGFPSGVYRKVDNLENCINDYYKSMRYQY